MNRTQPHLFRHGDLVFRKSDSRHKQELKKVKDYVVAGNDTAPHTVLGVSEILREGEGRNSRLLLRLHNPTRITHAGRHTEGMLDAGDYFVASLVEGPGRDGVED